MRNNDEIRKRSNAKPVETETETETETDAAPAAVVRTPSRSRAQPRAPGEKFAPSTDTKSRTIWTLIMIFSFFFIISLGHMYIVLLVFGLNCVIFKEILQLRRNHEKENHIPYFRILNWYFFMVTWYFLGIRMLGSRLDLLSLSVPAVDILIKQHAFKSFALHLIGFVVFVISLEKGLYRYQFGQFAWTHLTLLFVTCQTSLMIVNIYDGIVWFFLGTGLVIWNDIFAFVFGRWLGRTPLIKISPKKTWEGFIGSFVTTVMFSVVFSYIISLFPQLVCPQEHITFRPFSMPDCTPSYFFQPQPHTINLGNIPILSSIFDLSSDMLRVSFVCKPILLHAMAFATFASLVAPFGGFFASGFKRAFKIKDFGDSIPGHGGITDRMDCQIMMTLFVYVYRTTFLSAPTSHEAVFTQVAMMSAEQQLQLFTELAKVLGERGLLPV